MYHAVESAVRNHTNEWNTHVAFSDAYTRFLGAVTEIVSQRIIEESDRTGRTAEKDEMRGLMSEKALEIGGALVALAEAMGNADLQARVNLTRSDFYHGRDTTALTNAQIISEEATTYLNQLGDYLVTSQTLGTLNSYIAQFQFLLGEPRSQQAIAMAASEEIDRQFAVADRILKKEMDMLMRRWAGTAFHDEYLTVRVIVDH